MYCDPNINVVFYLFKTCEQERRQREFEANLEKQRQIEADRNKKALDRALAPPYIKVNVVPGYCISKNYYKICFFQPEVKALMPPSPVMRRRKPNRKMSQNINPRNPLAGLMSGNSPSSQ